MLGIISPGYFIRDLTVLLLSGAIVVMLIVMEKRIKSNLGYSYFIRVFNALLLAFILVVVAQTIGVLMRTNVLYGNLAAEEIRSILLTLGALFLFISSFMLYVPFAHGKYMIVPVAVEPAENLKYGAYWGDREKAQEVFLKLTKRERLPGIAVTRDPPEVFRGKLGLKLIPAIWVSKVQHEDAVNPTRLAHILENLRHFLEATNMDKVILVDCIEYLILENGEEAVLKFITSLKDFATLNRGILIVALDREAVGERTFNMLASELRPIEELEESLREVHGE